MTATIYKTSKGLMRILADVTKLEAIAEEDMDIDITIKRRRSYEMLYHEVNDLIKKTNDPKLRKMRKKIKEVYISYINDHFLGPNDQISKLEFDIFGN
jgi:hypothetical protein